MSTKTQDVYEEYEDGVLVRKTTTIVEEWPKQPTTGVPKEWATGGIISVKTDVSDRITTT